MDKIKKFSGCFLVLILTFCMVSCSPPRAKNPGFSSRYDVKRYAYLGLANIREGKYRAARQYFSAGLREDPRNCPLNFFNGLSYQLEGNDGSVKLLDLARVGYENAMRACPDDPWAFYYNGTLAAQQDDYVLAERMFAAASNLSGNHVSVFLKGYLYAAYRLGD
ncbi:MAG TPA: hypothetical protein VI844_02065, partial [Coxiellaceae bacterium]|nr:hypothetical protein [Coxiellaceae bacterium]